jgi:hypothetical protein
MRLFCVGVSRLSLACAFVRPESEQNSSRLQTDVPLPCRLDLGTFPMQQLISWSRRRFAQVRSQRAEKERSETRFACDGDRFAEVFDRRAVGQRKPGVALHPLGASMGAATFPPCQKTNS